MRNSERGFMLITVYLILAVLMTLVGALVAHAMAEAWNTQRSQASMRALYLAEAGIDRTLGQLRLDYDWQSGYSSVSLGNGNYSVSVQPIGDRRRLTAQGTATFAQGTAVRSVEAIIQQKIPTGFYDNIIWAAKELDLRGNSFQITGDVRHADTSPTGNFGKINGTVTYDPAANPLPRLSFQQLYNIAASQGNVYNSARLNGGPGVFPTSFWYSPPTDPNDPTTGIPNVNYVTTDLILNGNIGTIGGFFVVVGNVLTDPSAVEDTTINGNGQIAGAIYTTGDFRINGGGNGFNINGGVWAGDEARVNGNATLAYNFTYMNAIKALNINADVQVVSWQDLE